MNNIWLHMRLIGNPLSSLPTYPLTPFPIIILLRPHNPHRHLSLLLHRTFKQSLIAPPIITYSPHNNELALLLITAPIMSCGWMLHRTFKQSVIALERHRQKRLNLLIDTLDTGADQENNSGDDIDNDNDSLDAGGSIGPASPLHDKPAGNI